MDTINKNVLMLEFSFLSHRLLLPPTAALMLLHQKEPRCQEVTAAPLSLCPNSGIHPTSCWGTTASLSRDTTSTADGALTVRRRKCQANKCVPEMLLLCSLVTEWMCFREETVGDRPVSGDEHSVQVLVLLPEGQLQQEDVRGVQTVRGGRR